MPGVGVAPFGTGVLPIVFGSGMPGVGVVPFGILFILTELGSGIPGVEFPLGVTGVVENSGGMFAGVVVFELLAELEFPLGAVAVEQAVFSATIKINVINASFFINNKTSKNLK